MFPIHFVLAPTLGNFLKEILDKDEEEEDDGEE